MPPSSAPGAAHEARVAAHEPPYGELLPPHADACRFLNVDSIPGERLPSGLSTAGASRGLLAIAGAARGALDWGQTSRTGPGYGRRVTQKSRSPRAATRGPLPAT
jgi:hypothetical protein